MALPGRSSGLVANPEEVDTLQCLAEHRFVESRTADDGTFHWFFTESGLNQLSYESGVGPGRLVLEPRGTLPISDQTPWELVSRLLSEGWEWRPLPNDVPQRLRLEWFDTERLVFWDVASP